MFDYVIIYRSWFENAAKLGTEKQAVVINQLIRYGLYDEIPDNSNDLMLDLLFSDWKPVVDASKNKRKGGAPKGNKNAAGHGAPKGNSNAKKNKQLKQTTYKEKEYTNNNNKEYILFRTASDVPAIKDAGNTDLYENSVTGFENGVADALPEWMRGGNDE